ncbi:endonuclease domain-containing protein [Methylovirgula sp. 4M-Z18]|uniref:endonuclease domain-containing protein n=1 Tax=Methylovirgula sp. 4M-Z18 TaxID=2293567 RepID=UPI000E2FA0A1|nr:DUF559 domain-containing protein [Methylovirgula sp. 4M-Z18]RFB78559.1 endonuclease domain-containing protein [Methylovirgula sp. 4M-Z18]
MTSKHIEIARKLRAEQTSTEELLWLCLRARRLGGLKFRRQFPIAGFVADFCCPALRLTIELDGKHHAEEIEKDLKRRRVIESHGYLELRFTNDDIKERLDWVTQEILRAADTARNRDAV